MAYHAGLEYAGIKLTIQHSGTNTLKTVYKDKLNEGGF